MAQTSPYRGPQLPNRTSRPAVDFELVWASEVWLIGDGGAVLGGPPDAPLIRLSLSAPPLTLRNLAIHGQVLVEGGQLTVENCTFHGGQGDTGGALDIRAGIVHVTRTDFTDNAARLGGAVSVTGGNTWFSRSRFTRNTASEGGGAIAQGDLETRSSVAVRSSDFVLNHAKRGGAFLLRKGEADFSATTFLQNDASEAGGAIFLEGGRMFFRDRSSLRDNTAMSRRESVRIVADAGRLEYHLPAPLGFWVETGCESCKAALFTLGACSPGTDCVHTIAELPRACTPGMKGNSSETASQSSALCDGPCDEGHFCGPATVLPAPCPSGTFCPRGSSVALPCPAGRFSPTTELASDSGCFTCPKGHMCTTGAVKATACSPGSYAPRIGNDACVACSTGRYQNTSGMDGCDECGAGYVCPIGSSARLPATCNPGTYPGPDFKDPGDCLSCPPGSACAGGKAMPRSCTPGFHADGWGTAECAACMGGTFQLTSNATACLKCATGSFCPVGASTPLPCPKGSFSGAVGLAVSEQCVPCPLGSSCSTGSTEPTACTPGRYASNERSASCQPCDAGAYQPNLNAVGCFICPEFAFCPRGSSQPVPCRAGYFGPSPGLQNETGCAVCPPGEGSLVAGLATTTHHASNHHITLRYWKSSGETCYALTSHCALARRLLVLGWQAFLVHPGHVQQSYRCR